MSRFGVQALASLVWLAAWLPAGAAQAVIQPGEPAPPFTLQDLEGRTQCLDRQTSDVVLLLFVKPDDEHSSAALVDLMRMFERNPTLEAGLRRLMIVSRIGGREIESSPTLKFFSSFTSRWPVLLDRDDRLYRAYKIIATPTIVIVGPDRRAAAVHPGYDPGLIQDVRLELARVLGRELPVAATATPPPPNMHLQLGRRLAERGLWERALSYYRKAAEAGPLPDQARLEIARIYLKLERYEEAISAAGEIGPDSPLAEEAAAVADRARQAQKEEQPPPEPPRVVR
jgi:hypothetical protein